MKTPSIAQEWQVFEQRARKLGFSEPFITEFKNMFYGGFNAAVGVFFQALANSELTPEFIASIQQELEGYVDGLSKVPA